MAQSNIYCTNKILQHRKGIAKTWSALVQVFLTIPFICLKLAIKLVSLLGECSHLSDQKLHCVHGPFNVFAQKKSQAIINLPLLPAKKKMETEGGVCGSGNKLRLFFFRYTSHSLHPHFIFTFCSLQSNVCTPQTQQLSRQNGRNHKTASSVPIMHHRHGMVRRKKTPHTAHRERRALSLMAHSPGFFFFFSFPTK